SIDFNDRFIHWNDNVDPAAPWPTRPRARFPAFWECKMDGTPDNDHGANSANALQSMLLQSDGKQIFLLPAWPEDWDVSFKLCVPGNTTVECVYRDGKVQSLKVMPRARRADIVDFSSLANRIRTLVGVTCADRNYLFGLPPMLDGLPKSGKTTGPWLKKYGESLTGTKAGPWAGCVFRGNTVYQHRLDGPLALPEIPAKLVSKTYLTGNDEKPDTIIKLEYDRPVEEFAMAAPSQGSFTTGRQPVNGELDLGQPVAFDRVEFTVDHPDHKRGEGKPFELQMKQPDGTWRTVHQGRYFGTIYSKRFEPVTGQFVRLTVGGAGVRQFDLFLTDAQQYMRKATARLQALTTAVTEALARRPAPADAAVVQAALIRGNGLLGGKSPVLHEIQSVIQLLEPALQELNNPPLPPPERNLALRKTVQASSIHPATSVQALTAGQRSGDPFWSSGEAQLNIDHREWVMVDLGQTTPVNTVFLFPRRSDKGEGYPLDLRISLSMDGTEWKTAVSVDETPETEGKPCGYEFKARPARYVRIEGTRLREQLGLGRYALQLSAVEVFGPER
ncbi:MAG: discoidin domain-containing protein, partial [bacterium]